MCFPQKTAFPPQCALSAVWIWLRADNMPIKSDRAAAVRQPHVDLDLQHGCFLLKCLPAEFESSFTLRAIQFSCKNLTNHLGKWPTEWVSLDPFGVKRRYECEDERGRPLGKT
jgi:hypothetical protein